jgi:hypothetical protein
VKAKICYPERLKDSSFQHLTEAPVWCTLSLVRKQTNRSVVEKKGGEQRQMKEKLENLLQRTVRIKKNKRINNRTI